MSSLRPGHHDHGSIKESDIGQRPNRTRLLVQIPRAVHEVISRELEDYPDWCWYFVFVDTKDWPLKVRETVHRFATDFRLQEIARLLDGQEIESAAG